MALKDRLSAALKVIVSVALIAFLFSRVELERVGRAIASANYLYLALALALYFAAITVGCFKWQILLAAQGIEVSLNRLLSYTFVGLFFGNFLPTNVGGDLVRGYDLARHIRGGAEAAISVLVDRLVGLIAFMSMALFMAIIASFVADQAGLQRVAIAAAAALAIFAGGFALILSHRLRAKVELLFRLPLLSTFAPLYGRLSRALQAYRHSYSALVRAFFISASVLIITGFVNHLIAEALGGGIPLLYIFLFNPLIAFVLLVPISVGGIGLNQSAYVFFFSLIGVPEVKSLSLSLIMQVIILVSSLPGGFLWWRGRGLRALELGSETALEG